MNSRWHRFLSCGLMVTLLMIGLSCSLKASQSLEDVEPRISMYEDISYQCYYNMTTGYVENLKLHYIYLQAYDLVADSSHNLTLLIEEAKVSRTEFRPEIGGTANNISAQNKEYVIALFNGSWCDLDVWFEKLEDTVDPLNMLVVPYDTEFFSQDSEGNLFFGLWLNASSYIDEVNLKIGSRSSNSHSIVDFTVVTDLNYDGLSYGRDAQLRLLNVSRGNHFLQFKVQYNAWEGGFILEASTRQEDMGTIQMTCFLDNHVMFPFRTLNLKYSTKKLEFYQGVLPWIYAYSDPVSYCLNFTAPKNFILRIDCTSREQVDFLLIDSLITNVSIKRSSYCDVPRYEISLKLESNSNISLGLTLHDKTWFLRPTIMRQQDIPLEIRETFTNPYSSYDGLYIDVNNPLVESWAEQVVQNESNPYLVAHSLYENLTSPETGFQYDMNFSDPYASATLQQRKGVCRHFARAYAGLCMAAKLPARTVVGTGFGILNETVKKNHEWCEIYLPQYGWVTVDPTWGLRRPERNFGVLSNKHVLASYWNYVEGTLNVTKSSSELLASAKRLTQGTLERLIELCRTEIEGIAANVVHESVLLDQAEALGRNGYIHRALLTTSEIFVSVETDSPKREPLICQVSTLMLLATISMLVFIVLRLKRRIVNANVQADKSLQHSSRQKRFSRARLDS